MHRKLIGLLHIGSDELGAAVLQRGEEGHRSAEPIQLGNDEGGARDLAALQSLHQFRPIGTLPAFDLFEGWCDQVEAPCPAQLLNGGTLGS